MPLLETDPTIRTPTEIVNRPIILKEFYQPRRDHKRF